MFLDFVQGASLMLALCWLQAASLRFWRDRTVPRQLTSGLLFGLICAVGMLFPVTLSPGVIIDARSVVIAIAALLGGPLVGGVTYVVAALMRWWIGGAGMIAGVVGMLIPLALGLGYRKFVARRKYKLGAMQFLLFGVVVQVFNLLLAALLSNVLSGETRQVFALFLVVLPLFTMGMGLLLLDIDARVRVIDALSQSEAGLRALVSAVPDILLVIDEDGHYLHVVSPYRATLYGNAPDLVGQRMSDVLPASDAELFMGLVRRALHSSVPQELEYTAVHDGVKRTFEVRAGKMDEQFGGRRSVVLVTRDVTQRRAAEEQLLTLTMYDPLTDLPNRRLFLAQLPLARRESASNRRFAAVINIDLDDFADFNDLNGNRAGDQMLRSAAESLAALVPPGGMLARLGGDEFVMLLEALPMEEQAAAAVAARIARRAIEAVSLVVVAAAGPGAPEPSRVTASAGIALFRDLNDNDNPMRRANVALNAAKADGKSRVRIYDPLIQDAISARLMLEGEIRLGLQRDEFVVHYQLQLDAVRRITGVEALVRWQHPVRGLLYPADFLAVADAAGLLHELDMQVLARACRQLAVWANEAFSAPLVISVNVDAFQLSRVTFASEVMEVLDKSGADASRLKLELTETALVNDTALATRHMMALKARGVRFALDDFGTGYSSMAYLQQLPLDQLKIDQSFVRGLPADAGSLAIVRAIVALADSFGFEVLAEGVETEAQREVLAAHGCRHYQGYLFARPLPVEAVERMLRVEFA
ncbi:putative bifunctional diguanylate cyclase/phosphodiesterase [Variovorax sp. RHLX14]|uniref:putative bifunctional diguanylate cyclase/phosphodiesterase n=1 Tax=Variovorax sp. RHLX14 TaxID=1259731 RepID=UPI003F475042